MRSVLRRSGWVRIHRSVASAGISLPTRLNCGHSRRDNREESTTPARLWRQIASRKPCSRECGSARQGRSFSSQRSRAGYVMLSSGPIQSMESRNLSLIGCHGQLLRHIGCLCRLSRHLPGQEESRPASPLASTAISASRRERLNTAFETTNSNRSSGYAIRNSRRLDDSHGKQKRVSGSVILSVPDGRNCLEPAMQALVAIARTSFRINRCSDCGNFLGRGRRGVAVACPIKETNHGSSPQACSAPPKCGADGLCGERVPPACERSDIRNGVHQTHFVPCELARTSLQDNLSEMSYVICDYGYRRVLWARRQQGGVLACMH